MAHSLFWIAWSRGALQLLTFATTLFVARILVPADYGVMAIATFFIAQASMLSEWASGPRLSSFAIWTAGILTFASGSR